MKDEAENFQLGRLAFIQVRWLVCLKPQQLGGGGRVQTLPPNHSLAQSLGFANLVVSNPFFLALVGQVKVVCINKAP